MDMKSIKSADHARNLISKMISEEDFNKIPRPGILDSYAEQAIDKLIQIPIWFADFTTFDDYHQFTLHQAIFSLIYYLNNRQSGSKANDHRKRMLEEALRGSEMIIHFFED